MGKLTPNNAREFVKAQAEAQHIEKAISFTVKVMLAANGMNQATLSERLGLKRSTMSIKLAGRSSWSVPNLVETAYILNTTPQALMDDTFMTRMEKMRSSEQKPSELPVAESMIQDEQGKKKSEE